MTIRNDDWLFVIANSYLQSPTPMSETLQINEIYHSIQGESTRAGMPCVFVRLTGCHLRCGYCDTEYAFHGGQSRTIEQVIDEVRDVACDLVEITGGEPLLQPNVHPLMSRLCADGFTVLLETSGACDIATCDPRVIRIVDMKTPDSDETDHIDWSVLGHLTQRDEVKFVICGRSDYEWARDVLRKHRLNERTAAVLFSPVHEVRPGTELPGAEGLHPRDLAQWVLADKLSVRLQPQMHKVIWDPMARGV